MRWKYLFIFDNLNFLVEDQGILYSFKFKIHVCFTYSSYNWFYIIEWYFFFYLRKGRWLLIQSFLVIVVEKIYLSKHISLKLIEARSFLDVRLCLWVCTLTHSVLSGSNACGPMEPTMLLRPWDFPGNWRGLPFPPQGIFPNQVLNLCLLCLPISKYLKFIS